MTKITIILSILFISFSVFFAQEKILTSSGNIYNSNDAIPINSQEYSSKFGNKKHFFQRNNFYFKNDIADTLNWDVTPDYTFIFQGKSRLVQWFEAPSNMVIHAAGFNANRVVVEGSEISLQIVKLNWTKNQIMQFGENNIGYYTANGNGYNDATAFSFDPDRTGEWVWAVDTLFTEPFGEKLWPLQGEEIAMPIADGNYQWYSMGTDISVTAGDILGVVVENLAPTVGDNPIGFAAEVNEGLPCFKYYPNGRSDPSLDLGWWTRDFTLDFALAVTLEGVTPISEVIEDLNSDFVPDHIGESFNVVGVVTTTNFTAGLGRLNVFIQDETAGINLYQTTLNDNYPIGTKVSVTGELTQYNGLSELLISSIEIVGQDQVPAPIEVTVSQWLANPEQYEGRLIKINNVSKVQGDWPAENSNVNLTMSDSSSTTFTMRIDADTDIDGSTEPSYPISIVGVASQFTSADPPNDGYQIIPRMLSDITSDNGTIQVTFNCDMSVQIASGVFDAVTGVLSVRGDFQALLGDPGGADWSGNYFQLSDPDGDQVFSLTVDFPESSLGNVHLYKFVMDDLWETNENRSFTVEAPSTNLPTYYFSDDTEINPILTTDVNLRFSVDMNHNPLNYKDGSSIPLEDLEFVGVKGGPAPLGSWNGFFVPEDTLSGTMIALHDDGTFGDLVSGDNIWSRIITFPAGSPIGDFAYKYAAWYPNAAVISNDFPMDNEAGYGNDHHFDLAQSSEIVEVANIWADQIEQETPIGDAIVDSNNDFVPDRIGQYVKIRGIITSPNFNEGIGHTNYFLQDETGGINIFDLDLPCCEFPIGLEVVIGGTISQYNGLNQIDNINYSVTQTMKEVPDILSFISVAAWLADAEPYEGQLINLSNLTKVSGDWPTEGQSANLTFTDGTTEFTLRIDSDTDIDGSAEPTYPINIVGIASQFTTSDPPNNGYQILPRMLSDITQSQNGDCILVSLDDMEIQSQNDFSLPLGTDDITGENIVSYQFVIKYDTNLLEAVSPFVSTAGTMTPSNWFILGNETELGTISVAASGASAISGNGELIKLLFHSKDIEGTATVNFSEFIYNTGTPCVSTQNGNVTISNCSCGDVDCNGSVMAYDASQILQTVVGLIDIGDLCGCASAADINQDGMIMAYDASMVLMEVVGLPVPEPNCFGGTANMNIAKASEINLKIKSENVTVEMGKTKIKLALDGFTKNDGVYSLQFNIDPQVEVEQLYLKTTEGYLYAINNENNIYRVAIANPKGIYANDIEINIITNDEHGLDETTFSEVFINTNKSENITLTGLNKNMMVKNFSLVGAYPNPFNPTTKIIYEVPTNSLVTIDIYNILGQRVWSKKNIEVNQGRHELEWNGVDDYSQKVASGLYIATMRSGKYFNSIKLNLIK